MGNPFLSAYDILGDQCRCRCMTTDASRASGMSQIRQQTVLYSMLQKRMRTELCKVCSYKFHG